MATELIYLKHYFGKVISQVEALAAHCDEANAPGIAKQVREAQANLQAADDSIKITATA